ncbi:MAG TPA: hypothetical protein VE077_15395 [Candidatus Methylomirabilis sp.]|nr:hypothetical protein [Candidatus Methylomirabilis sp.]
MADHDPQPQPATGAPAAPKKANGKDVLLRVTDPEGYEIKLDLDRWEKHIVVGHPEMKDYLDLVAKTLAEPEVIKHSPVQDETYFYYRLTGRSFHRKNDIYMSVVVQRDEETKKGFVKTAHLVKKMNPAGETIWMRRN